jgi:membrane-associated phospholipid phosphatase
MTSTRRGLVLLAAGFLICSLLILFFAALFSGGSPGRFDMWMTTGVRTLHTPERDRLLGGLTFIGSHLFLLPATAVVAVGLAAAHRRGLALLLLFAVAGGSGLNAILKLAFRRERPDLWPALALEPSYSFPSGHAAMTTVFCGALLVVLFRLTRRRKVRAAATATALVLVAAIGATRLYLGAHWATDIAAGFFVGLFWVMVCVVVAARLDPPPRSVSSGEGEGGP